jgi:hypothetical protein
LHLAYLIVDWKLIWYDTAQQRQIQIGFHQPAAESLENPTRDSWLARKVRYTQRAWNESGGGLDESFAMWKYSSASNSRVKANRRRRIRIKWINLNANRKDLRINSRQWRPKWL